MTTKKSTSTDDYDPTKFRPHGRVTFSTDHNILMCEAVGPFNKELIEAIANAEKGMVEQMLAFDKWADIVIIKKNAMASPDDLAAFTAYLTMLGRNNLNSFVTAMVIDDDVEGAEVMTHQIIDAYMEAGINLTVFKHLNDAKVFVRLHL
jgi:hypothetical protein